MFIMEAIMMNVVPHSATSCCTCFPRPIESVSLPIDQIFFATYSLEYIVTPSWNFATEPIEPKTNSSWLWWLVLHAVCLSSRFSCGNGGYSLLLSRILVDAEIG